MILRRLTDELGFVLLESSGRVIIDMDKYEEALKDEMQDLYDWAVRRNGKADFDPDKEARTLFPKSMKNMHKLGSGLGRILSKLDLDVGIQIYPDYSKDNMFEPVKHAYVKLFKGSKPGRGAPGFSYFGPREVDDVLEAGDADFFHDEELEIAYFKLVNEIRNPGSANKSGKPTKVFTARPKKDRGIYDGTKNVPSGIFVTNNADRAQGFGSDLGSTEGRDLWKIVVDSKYLVQTLKAGRVRDYQIVGQGKVPIKSIERLS